MAAIRASIESAMDGQGQLVDSLLNNQHAEYIPSGTAGFRGKVELVQHLFSRVGLIAGVKCMLECANVGVMITASHNPVEDNGVKIIDSRGEMLDSRWELMVEEFCNFKTATSQELLDKLFSLMNENQCGDVHQSDLSRRRRRKEEIRATQAQVFVACDTRPSSMRLVEQVTRAFDLCTNMKHQFMGVITTPALHFIVGESTRRQSSSIQCSDYYDKLIQGFVKSSSSSKTQSKKYYQPDKLVVDCANGVGLETMRYLNMNQEFNKCLPVALINVGERPDDVLNSECGADYVKTRKTPPKGANELDRRYASLDGDADRVVYFYLDENLHGGDSPKQLRLLDGDKILVLYVKFLLDLLKKYNLKDSLTLGAIQTAYANGASTSYLEEELGLKRVDCVDTGVKHLHKRALNYDLGVYFEANGHGTIWVSDKARSMIEQKDASELQNLLDVLNNYTGDAISDILMVEMILRHYDWNVKQWYELYRDRANSLIKVEVKDRNSVVTTNAGRTCVKPDGLQAQIDQIVSQSGLGSRCFVRASGTENVVRIYAESSQQKSADELSHLVGQKVIEFCNT